MPPADGEILYRRHLRKPGVEEITYCGRAVVPCPNDRKLRQCGLCNRNSARERAAKPKPAVAPQPPRGGSIRTVSGGLPGLGRR